MSHDLHVADLRLRRFRLGELPAPDQSEVVRHTTACAPCRARLKMLDDEQRQFESEIPFERFAGGVERARRVPRARHPGRALVGAALGLAAAAGVLLVLRAVPSDPPASSNRLKGAAAAEATLRIAHTDGSEQRTLDPGGTLALSVGDRLRLGFRSSAARYLVAVSVDDAGVVTPLYPERGALAVAAQPALSYLPDSLELTGRGGERLFLLLIERPTNVDDVARATRDAHARAGGDLRALASLPLDGHGKVEQFTWLLAKP